MWTNYLITGIKTTGLIILAALLFSCKGDDTEPGVLIRTDYRFVNTLEDTIVLIGYVRGIESKWIATFNKFIKPKDSIIDFTEWNTAVQIARPFENSGFEADSVVLRFKHNKCTGYRGPLQSSPDVEGIQGLFNVNNYRNYQRGMFAGQFPYFFLSYDIGARDTLLAVPCQ
jgi:hypothetical protein